MKSTNFSKFPMSSDEKKRKEDEFINASDKKNKSIIKRRNMKERKEKQLCLRVPESLWKGLQEIITNRSLSMNAICIEMLESQIRKKLKEINDIDII